MRKTTKHSAGARIVKGLTELVEAMEKAPLASRFSMKTIELPEKPGQYTPRLVRATRDRLSASQPVFASLMGVSTGLVQHWEQGFRKPSTMACRLLDEINRDPARWMKMMDVKKSA